ncbi:MAG TPA: adenylate/guanylate cyclase domain-containing protein [Alphaproteobacteria bacterium]|nr:adenylate/guanylate cyclase domain-containing protein [Alphaproteobacteria bacterium]
MAGRDSSDQAVADWLLDQALLAPRIEALLPRFAERLGATGLDLARIFFGGTILHPEYDSFSCIWTPEALQTADHPYDDENIDWQASPIRQAITEKREITRYRLRDGDGCDRFPLLESFRTRGLTDYVILLAIFGYDGTAAEDRDVGIVASFATDRPEGFSAADLELLAQCRRPLSLAARNAVSMRVISTLLTTYLGQDVGQRILSGAVRRGRTQVINAAILWADLRGFTLLADTVPRGRLVAMLDDYFECMAAPVERHGGQVLKFMGDGMLATFAFDDADVPAACGAAAAAATAAIERTAALNLRRAGRGEATMALDVALHVGEVLYGNVGGQSRMDFTVIGPAVNEASRMEALCGALDCPLLASRAFVAASDAPGRFRSVGAHRLRGVREPQELFTLPDYNRP